jgi:hypothetical protein
VPQKKKRKKEKRERERSSVGYVVALPNWRLFDCLTEGMMEKCKGCAGW